MPRPTRLAALCAAAAAGLAAAAAPAADVPDFVFRDIAPAVGLVEPLRGANAHAAAWGDIDGDGRLDLFVGTFADKAGGGGLPNVLLWNLGKGAGGAGPFGTDPDPALRSTGRGTGAVLADFDNDGLLDLYVANHSRPAAGADAAAGRTDRFYRALPGRKWQDVTDASGAVRGGVTSRNVAVLDFDGDGLLDLLVVHAVGKGPGRKTTLYRNLGNFRFEAANAKAGIPDDVVGLGACVGDVNGDSWPDIFVGGSNRLFLSQGDGTYKEAAALSKALDWKFAAEDNAPSAGVAFGDVDHDGRPDLVIGMHLKRPWAQPAPVRLFMNRGCTKTEANFVEVTADVGLTPIPMKAPHVELRDFDNDGWPDLYSAIVVFDQKDGTPRPAVWKNLGVQAGTKLPKFADTAFRHRPDFPDAGDRTGGTAAFYEKLLKERKITYMATGPSGDVDGDGRLDLFLASWFPEQPSMLLKNETPGGRWLDVRVAPAKGSGINAMGIGSKVTAYAAGKAGDPAAMISSEEIQTGYGYTCGQPAVAHLGLAANEAVDVVIELPCGKGKVVKKGVTAAQVLVVVP
ncbi:MAG TPA: VCBS repeat-containing protein [Humisphaera sp.]